MRCPECGAPVPDGESRCPECKKPVAGQPRRAPRGSDAPPDEPGTPTFWNAVFWAGLALVLLAALAAVLLG